MARPQKQTVDYFPHESHASDGTTLTILEGKYGNDGYALWFKLLERLSATPGHVIDCRNPIIWEFLQVKTHLSEGSLNSILNLLVELKAIDADLWANRLIWCQNLVDNIADVYKNRRVLIPQKPPINGSNPTAGVVSTDDNPTKHSVAVVSTSKSTQSKLKETKLKESKVNIYSLWNEQKIIIHKKLTPEIETAINVALMEYSLEDILLGIKNYAEIQKGDQYYFKYAWTLKDFLKRGLSKFIDIEIARQNYVKGKEDGTHKQDTKPIKATGIRIIS